MTIIRNLYDVSGFPYWLETVDLIGWVRTSTSQNDEPCDGAYQEAAIVEFAQAHGYNIDTMFRAIGEDGHRIFQGLRVVIAYAELTRFPIIAFDETRLSRKPQKLAAHPRVQFISLTPLGTPEHELRSIRRRAANKFNPEGRGGRPATDIPVDKIRDWLQLGVSCRDIQKLTGVSKSTVQRIAKLSQNSLCTCGMGDS